MVGITAWLLPPDFQLGPAPPHLPDAACRGVDTGIFFPHRGESPEPARQLCRTCPAVEPCRTFAIDHPRMPGIWGGLSHQQRLHARRRTTAVSLTGEPTTTTRRDVPTVEPAPADGQPIVQVTVDLGRAGLAVCFDVDGWHLTARSQGEDR